MDAPGEAVSEGACKGDTKERSRVAWYGGSMPYTQRDGVRIFFDTHGDGPPLLLCPGLGSLMEHWGDAIAAFSPYYRVIVFDPRGGPESDSPAGNYSMRDLAEDAVAVLDAVAVERTHVYGISMGGHIAQQLALDHPDRVRSLVLVVSSDRTSEVSKERLRVWRDARRLSIELYARAVGYAIFGEELFAKPLWVEGWRRRSVQDEQRWNPQGLEGRLAACLAYDTSSRSSEIRCPTLLVAGRRDLCILPHESEAHAARIPGAQYVLLDVAHVIADQDAQELNARVLAFLAHCPAEAAS